jgi:hypothetical protein
MKVDRTKFLLLTGALSAATTVALMSTSGCTTTSATTDGGATQPTGDSGPDSTTEDGGACLGDSVVEGGDAASYDCSQSTCATDCTNVQGAYRAGIAQDAVQCILALPTCESGGAEARKCAEDALAKACDDAAATSLCTKLVADCTAPSDAGYDADASTADAGSGAAFDQASCVALVRALSDEARTTFTSCVTEGAGAGNGFCKTDPVTCLDALRP